MGRRRDRDLHAGGIHPDLPGTAYFDLAAEVKRRQPEIHLHSYSPMEVLNGATRTNLSIRDWLIKAKESGVDSLPGTAAEILDDDVRWVLTKGKLPTSEWIKVVTTAHEVGLPTTSTMMYGHVDTPAHWVGHLKLLAKLQREGLEKNGRRGFSEFVLLRSSTRARRSISPASPGRARRSGKTGPCTRFPGCCCTG